MSPPIEPISPATALITRATSPLPLSLSAEGDTSGGVVPAVVGDVDAGGSLAVDVGVPEGSPSELRGVVGEDAGGGVEVGEGVSPPGASSSEPDVNAPARSTTPTTRTISPMTARTMPLRRVRRR